MLFRKLEHISGQKNILNIAHLGLWGKKGYCLVIFIISKRRIGFGIGHGIWTEWQEVSQTLPLDVWTFECEG